MSEVAEPSTALLAALAAILALPAVLAVVARPRRPRDVRRTVVVVSCEGCGYTEKRGYEQGLYVGMRLGACPRCGSDLRVDAIYEERVNPSKA